VNPWSPRVMGGVRLKVRMKVKFRVRVRVRLGLELGLRLVGFRVRDLARDKISVKVRTRFRMRVPRTRPMCVSTRCLNSFFFFSESRQLQRKFALFPVHPIDLIHGLGL
jgi:hypothetical protein